MIHAVPAAGDPPPAFPIRTVGLGMAAMVVLLLLSTLSTWRVGNEIRHLIDAQVRVITTAQRLEHYGDVLVLSIKAVVAHGDTGSAAEYRETQPKLRSTMVALRTQVQTADNALEAARVDRADLALVAMEYQALDLVSRGEVSEARQLIGGPRYNHLLVIYENGLRGIRERAEQYAEKARADLHSDLRLIVGLSAASLLLMIAGWCALIRPARRWGEQLDEARMVAELSARELTRKQAELEILNRKLFDQARTDPLTGLQTRLKFNEDVAELWPKVGRPTEMHCALMCDVDFFKQYNDTYGHLPGDRVLQSVATALRSALRHDDQLYRFGGEEFLVILPFCEASDAERRAEQFRAAVEKLHIFHTGSPLGKVTLSIGAACLNVRHTKSPTAWINEADKALYVAKARGRNAVVTAGKVAA